MSTLAADVAYNFCSFNPCDPTSPPSFTFDASLLNLPYQPGHARSSSHGSAYSFESLPSDISTPSTRRTTPTRSPIRTHGPLLLPKIRSQDQAMTPSAIAGPAPKRARTSPSPSATRRATGAFRPSHSRSYTNPEPISFRSSMPFIDDGANSLLCAPVNFTHVEDEMVQQSRRASSCSLDSATIDKYGFPTYRQMPHYVPTSGRSTPTQQPQQLPMVSPEAFVYQPYTPRAASPLSAVASVSLSPEPTPSTTLMSYLTAPNPAPSLVHNISFPLRDPHTKHFWWDVRQVRPWANFTTSAILSIPGAAALLSCPVPAPLLPIPMTFQRHPETEAALHSIYASHYLPRVNAALSLFSQRPLQFSIPAKPTALPGSNSSLGMATDCMFVANVLGESATAAAMFGGKPTARVVGLVKSFDRFNTGMRAEGNVKRVEYLRGLAHLHHAMREHGCRYGFILTEIELVVVRNGGESTPHFGHLEVGIVQLAASDRDGDGDEQPLTACLALWGLAMLAADEPVAGHPHWKAEIGAPAEGTRRKALARDAWMPQPQLAEKREAKRARGWVWPEDAIGRKELGKRGVRYGAC